MTRQNQLWYLIGLTAVTLIPTYALQGWLASGHSAANVSWWLWFAESVMWAVRALVEAWAIVYLFQTMTANQNHATVLWVFKVALIALITLTVGPVLIAAGNQSTVKEALHPLAFLAWNFAVASYAPLMLGAVGVAYTIQPDTNLTIVKRKPDKEVAKVDTSPSPADTVLTMFGNLSEREQQIVEVIDSNPGLTSVDAIAQKMDLTRQAINGDVKRLKDAGVLSKNGSGFEVVY